MAKRLNQKLQSIPEAGNKPAEVIEAVSTAIDSKESVKESSTVPSVPVPVPEAVKVASEAVPEAKQEAKPQSKVPKRNLKTEQRKFGESAKKSSDNVLLPNTREEFLECRSDINKAMSLDSETLKHNREEFEKIVAELGVKIAINSLELGSGIKEDLKEDLYKFEEARLKRYKELFDDKKIDNKRYNQLCKQFAKTPLVLRKGKYYKLGVGKLRKSFDASKLYQFASQFGFESEKKTKELAKLFQKLESDKCIGTVRINVIKDINEIANFSKEFQKIHGHALTSLDTVLSENEGHFRLKVKRFTLRLQKYKYRIAVIDYISAYRNQEDKTRATRELAQFLNTDVKALKKFILYDL